VIEYSDVFAALGLKIVLADGLENAFVIEGGKFRSVVQPDLEPACMQAMGAGFALLVDWLQDSDDPLRDVLLSDGSLHLTGDTATILIQAVTDWHDETGWGSIREQAFEWAQVAAH
jgi:hypothetical protein